MVRFSRLGSTSTGRLTRWAKARRTSSVLTRPCWPSQARARTKAADLGALRHAHGQEILPPDQGNHADEPLRSLGVHTVTVRLHRQVRALLKVNIVAAPLWALGLSTRATALLLEGLEVDISAATVWRDALLLLWEAKGRLAQRGRPAWGWTASG